MGDIVEKRKPFGVTGREIARRFFRHEDSVIAVILGALVAGIAIMSHGRSISVANASNIMLQSSMRGVASIGQAFVILTAGIDLSVGGIALLAANFGALRMSGSSGFPAGPIALMLLVGLVAGAGNGALVSRVRIPALIATLASWQMLGGTAWMVTRGRAIVDLPPQLAFIGQERVGPIPIAFIIFIAVAVVAYLALNHTSFGRSVYAVGGNPVSAWLAGIKVPNILFAAYAISGLLAGLAGLIILSRSMAASLALTTGLELDSIAAVVIGGVSLFGGRGTLIGVVIGVFIISVINNGMNMMALHPAFQNIVKGAIIITAVAIDSMRRRTV